MSILTVSQLRKKFVDYFAAHQHRVVSSSSLIPANDPTLLFVNAGMVQFKDVFLGLEQRDYTRATSVQRCIRAGGKHNDLENVGFTARHHTFFEMLGNFSFGDYFKREAIRFAWDFLTKELALPREKLWVTVHDGDQEAEAIWLNEMGIDPVRFSRCGDKSNFWAMGDTGPCGPCTEIFYDHGPHIAGGPPGSPDEDGDRYVEIWNLVFMQYERQTDGQLKPLPKPSVDTGMGLERIAAVVQGVHTNYDIDLFQALIKKAAFLTSTADLQHASLKVIADHIRSCSFLITDGVRPSNEGRGYVLRRIIRRAARHGYKLGMKRPFFHGLVETLVEQMGEAYPELKQQKQIIDDVLMLEESRFKETLDAGMDLLGRAMHEFNNTQILPGEVAFKLYDTYGFPIDLTADILREQGWGLDQEGFDHAMQKQRERSQASGKFDLDYTKQINLGLKTEFIGYDHLEADSEILAILRNGEQVDTLTPDHGPAILVLNKTPFYAESGGQVGDQGLIEKAGHVFRVSDTKKIGDTYLHLGELESGVFKLNDLVQAKISKDTREKIKSNHSATHLLHAALRKILGNAIVQKGSLVSADRLRFDFAYDKALTAEQLKNISERVNEEIRNNHDVNTEMKSLKEAQSCGAMALFGEKYGDQVRVLSMGGFSKELCGGTHVHRTGDIGLFKITSESGIAAGVRRIEALTGQAALSLIDENENYLGEITQLLKVKSGDAADKIKQMQDQIKQHEKALQQLKLKLASGSKENSEASVLKVKEISLLVKQVDGLDIKTLREMLDAEKNKLAKGVVVLASVMDDKVQLLVGVTKELSKTINAGELIGFVAAQVGGKGGGRSDMAQAGGTNPSALPLALASVANWLEQRV